MAQFNYSAIKKDGERIDGTLKCQTRRDAIERLRQRGIHPINLREVGIATGASQNVTWDTFRRIKQTDLAIFTRQLASLLKAGLTVTNALKTLLQQSSNPKLTRVIEDLNDIISNEACSLSEAMDSHQKVFDPVYRGLVRSGEESGTLVSVLSSLAKRLTQADKLRGQVVNAFIYPIFLLLLGIAAIFVMMIFVIPKFQDLFESLGQSLPLPTQILIASSAFVSSWWYLIFLFFVLVIGLCVYAYRQPGSRLKIDAATLKLPVLGSMLLKVEVARVAQTLGGMVNSGVRIIDALKITGNTTSNAVIGHSFKGIIKGVSAGEPIADMFEKTSLFPVMMVNLIRTGEQTGELPEMLQELTEIYEEESERAVTAIVKLLEPVLVLFMGGVISGIVAAVILPIFNANAMTH